MDFVSIRIITSDVARLVEFYERATGVQASVVHRGLRRARDPDAHARHRQHPHRRAVRAGPARPADNHTVIIEFLVDDVDRVYRS